MIMGTRKIRPPMMVVLMSWKSLFISITPHLKAVSLKLVTPGDPFHGNTYLLFALDLPGPWDFSV
jgi:hypothetical protein